MKKARADRVLKEQEAAANESAEPDADDIEKERLKREDELLHYLEQNENMRMQNATIRRMKGGIVSKLGADFGIPLPVELEINVAIQQRALLKPIVMQPFVPLVIDIEAGLPSVLIPTT